MKRVLLISQFYPPDLGAAAGRVRFHCQALAGAGHVVHVVSPMATYPQGQLRSEDKGRLFKQETDGSVKVFRYRPIFVGNRKLMVRLIAEGWGSAVTLVMAFARALKADIIICTSPSPLLGMTGAVLKFLMPRKRYIWEVRDLTWQYAFELGKVRNRYVKSVTEWMVRWMARKADTIVTTNEVQRAYFLENGIAPSKVCVVYNGVSETELTLKPLDVCDPKSELIVAYVGLVGHAQGLSTLVEVAHRAESENLPLKFHIVGDGAELELVKEQARTRGLKSVVAYGAVDRSRLAFYYERADILFAQLRDKPVFRSALPSKLIEYMGTGRPVVFAGSGPGAELLERAHAGIVVKPEDAGAILDALRRILNLSPEERRLVGERGRGFVQTHFLHTDTAQMFVKNVEGI
jgi:colanic acid biosynthesis glycosyl transferase WcaI